MIQSNKNKYNVNCEETLNHFENITNLWGFSVVPITVGLFCFYVTRCTGVQFDMYLVCGFETNKFDHIGYIESKYTI